MRITDRMLSRNYVKTLQDNMYKYVQANNRIATGMKYENMSDNVADCSRALRADGQVQRLNQQIGGIQNVNAQLSAADETIQDLIDVFRDARSEIQKAMNASKDDTKISSIADQISNFKSEILQFTNGKFSEKYLFAGQNSGSAPFSVNADGKVAYNGIPTDEIFQGQDGNYYYNDGTVDRLIPQDGDIYLDVGRGIRVDGNSIDPASAFKISFSGLDILGYGVTTDPETGLEMSNNVYNLMQQVEDLLRSGEMGTEEGDQKMGALFDHMKVRLDALISNETDVGGRVNFLERTESRLKDQVDTLEEMKKQLIGNSDSGDEAKLLADAKAAYQATLTMGATLFQTSLLDFLR